MLIVPDTGAESVLCNRRRIDSPVMLLNYAEENKSLSLTEIALQFLVHLTQPLRFCLGARILAGIPFPASHLADIERFVGKIFCQVIITFRERIPKRFPERNARI